MTLLDAHIQFLKKNFKKGILDGANIGWVTCEESMTSKLYKAKVFVETYKVDDGFYSQISPMRAIGNYA